MTRAGLVLAVVSALCLGAAFGFASGVLFSHHVFRADGPMGFGPRGFREFRRGAPGSRGVPSARVLVPHLQRLLDLTPEQAEAIRLEIEATRGDFAKVRDSLHARIERHLTPAQRERWSAVVRERDPGEPGGPGPRRFRADPGWEGELSR